MKMTECPYCEGSGSFMVGLYPENGPNERMCHQCMGSGEIEIEDNFNKKEKKEKE